MITSVALVTFALLGSTAPSSETTAPGSETTAPSSETTAPSSETTAPGSVVDPDELPDLDRARELTAADRGYQAESPWEFGAQGAPSEERLHFGRDLARSLTPDLLQKAPTPVTDDDSICGSSLNFIWTGVRNMAICGGSGALAGLIGGGVVGFAPLYLLAEGGNFRGASGEAILFCCGAMAGWAAIWTIGMTLIGGILGVPAGCVWTIFSPGKDPPNLLKRLGGDDDDDEEEPAP